VSPRAIARLKALATFIVLGVVLLIGVTWAWAAITEPFPEREPTPPCVTTVIRAGEPLRPGAITISVLNAGGEEGLARQTMDDFTRRGFDEGELANAPGGTKVTRAQVWTTDRTNPAARLVRSYLGRTVKVVERDGGQPGINVVVGPGFTGVGKGLARIVLKEEASVCGPVVEE
jgi:hypothetical protein